MHALWPRCCMSGKRGNPPAPRAPPISSADDSHPCPFPCPERLTVTHLHRGSPNRQVRGLGAVHPRPGPAADGKALSGGSAPLRPGFHTRVSRELADAGRAPKRCCCRGPGQVVANVAKVGALPAMALHAPGGRALASGEYSDAYTLGNLCPITHRSLSSDPATGCCGCQRSA